VQRRLREPTFSQAPADSPAGQGLRHPAQADLGARRLEVPSLRVNHRTRDPSRTAEEPIRRGFRGQSHGTVRWLPPSGPQRVMKIMPEVQLAAAHACCQSGTRGQTASVLPSMGSLPPLLLMVPLRRGRRLAGHADRFQLGRDRACCQCLRTPLCPLCEPRYGGGYPAGLLPPDRMAEYKSAGVPPPNLTIAITFSVKLCASIRSVGENCAYGVRHLFLALRQVFAAQRPAVRFEFRVGSVALLVFDRTSQAAGLSRPCSWIR